MNTVAIIWHIHGWW